MQIFNKLAGTKGIVKAWEESLKNPVELHRARVLSFWKKHGLAATQEAFGVSRRTLFRWQSRAEQSTLAPKSRAPIRRRSVKLLYGEIMGVYLLVLVGTPLIVNLLGRRLLPG